MSLTVCIVSCSPPFAQQGADDIDGFFWQTPAVYMIKKSSCPLLRLRLDVRGAASTIILNRSLIDQAVPRGTRYFIPALYISSVGSRDMRLMGVMAYRPQPESISHSLYIQDKLFQNNHRSLR
jgi:hypothetical protein